MCNFRCGRPIDVKERICLSGQKEEGTNTDKLVSKLTISPLLQLEHFKVNQWASEANQKYRAVLNLERVGPFLPPLF